MGMRRKIRKFRQAQRARKVAGEQQVNQDEIPLSETGTNERYEHYENRSNKYAGLI
ncbi:conserved hypothetical protein [Ricinus communis]|uniref:Uncharacterized protein n=1 Tax=Ricinus communis TaxID=3988 RepID=B9RSJ5_RICCO|nr:conserved hypothetical protein [Ricinus communis]